MKSHHNVSVVLRMNTFHTQHGEKIEEGLARGQSAPHRRPTKVDSHDDLPFNQIDIYDQSDAGDGGGRKDAERKAMLEVDFSNSTSSHRAYEQHDFFDDVSNPNESGVEPILGELTGRAPPHDGRTKFVTAWLYQNYEVSENTSFPRSAVYDQYLEECKARGIECVNPATFGKVIRAIFKNLKTRRLGTRGNSKYHYFGIRPIINRTAEPITTSNVVAPILRKRFRMSLLKQEGHNCVDSQDSCILSDNPHLRSRRKHRDQTMDVPHRTHKMIQPLVTEVRYHPLIPNFEEFARFLEQICQPILEGLPHNVAADLMHSFSSLYQTHVVNMLRLISSRDFPMIEMALGMFWNNVPQRLWSCLHCEEGLRIISIADDYLFQVAIHILVPDVLESLPLPVAQSIRYFAKSLEIWMTHIFDSHVPQMVVESKMDIARRFCQVLRRRTSLNHLAQAVRSILGSPEHTNGMLRDFAHIDFGSIREQVGWVIAGQDEFLAFVEASFKNYLFEGASLQQWTQWIEGLVEQCLSLEMASGGSLEAAARAITLRWSFFTTMVMRDMTLRSASSFGKAREIYQ